MEFTDAQWEIVKPHLVSKAKGRGRPRHDERQVLEGILWVLRTGARWKDLPKEFPSYQTCHRRFSAWLRDGTLEQLLKAIAADLISRGKIDLSEAFIDGSFASAKKGAVALVKTKRGKGSKIMAIAECAGLPIALWIGSASPHEVTLVGRTLNHRFTAEQPKRLIGDKAYDSDKLDTQLRRQRKIEMIAPHRIVFNRRRSVTQDGRQL